MRIRNAVPEDIDTIFTIVQTTINSVYPKYYPEDVVNYFAGLHSLDNLKNALKTEYILLVEDFDQVIGTGALLGNEIKRVFVMPAFQGMGYGSLILDELEKKALENGYNEVVLYSSLPAYSLYQKRGYEPLEFYRMRTEKGQVLCYHKMLKTLNNKYSTVDYNNRVFASISNTDNGEVSNKTIFKYKQQNDIVWAHYSGGDIVKGFLIGKCDKDGKLEFNYQHININKEIRTGKCTSIPQILTDGRIRLIESWEWTNEDMSKGTSVIEEIRIGERKRLIDGEN